MGVYGDLQKLNQARKPGVPQAESPTEVPAVSPIPTPAQVQISAPEIQSRTFATKPQKTVFPKGKPMHQATMTPRHRDTTIPSNHDTTTPGNRDTMITTIRAAVKVFGKEAATHRFTPEEKRAIRDIVYAYEGQGLRTNENEIARIGINFLIEDYAANGENSILHQALQAIYS